MNIIGKKDIFLAISGVLVCGGIFAMLFYGFRLGVDFKGGSLWQIRVAADEASLKAALEEMGVAHPSITREPSNDSYAILSDEVTSEARAGFTERLRTQFGSAEDLDFWTTAPSVSRELKKNALIAIGLVLIGISLYVAYAFRRVSYPVSSFKYGVITLVTLAHDVAIPAGLFALLGHAKGIAIDTNFVVALLTIVGFSVHDTIVVFDRIRENLLKSAASLDLASLVNRSINETFRRSVNTSMTLILVLVAIFFLGPVSIKYFVLTILVGTVVGTYSSIFVASPLLVVWHERAARKIAPDGPGRKLT
ncbi:MAG: protein translocase subunit SecF [Candidatus Colwellbacteria bacterium]|nr:protein translocase subunit SecF [Candidatus Colwellbacteria bacterium]